MLYLEIFFLPSLLFPSPFQNLSLKQKVQDLEAQKEESTSEVLHFRQTLENTVSQKTNHSESLDVIIGTYISCFQMNILGELQTKVETSNGEHQLELKNKETALEMVKRIRPISWDCEVILCVWLL